MEELIQINTTAQGLIMKNGKIEGLSSKEVANDGLSFNVENNCGIKKDASSIEDEFLEQIGTWNKQLANNIHKNNNIKLADLNQVVQLIIDRIIFIRMAEEKGLEEYETLLKLSQKHNLYQEFIKLCKNTNKKYSNQLFHFQKDINIDMLAQNLKIDDIVLKKIIKNLYYPFFIYEFSQISPEMLGNIYERFLGKTIRITDKNLIEIDYTNENLKKKGVYYTPRYIVKYMVDNTVGKLIKDKTPNQISKIKILDPSCGSGIFLLEAYNNLLEYHLGYYTHLKKPPAGVVKQIDENHSTLTVKEKTRILLNNIHGVDIDSQAINVTKLSLLLKVLEAEDRTQTTLDNSNYPDCERIIQNLNNNIKCGNSLIESDILVQQELNNKQEKQLNPFDFSKNYSKNFDKNKGFDIIIGNPPYVNIELQTDEEKQYYKKNYEFFQKRSDIFSLFLERGLELSNKYTAFIVPNIILSNASYNKFRKYILNNKYLEEVCYTGYDVFKQVNVNTTIIILNKQNKKNEITLKNAVNFKKPIINNVPLDYFENFNNVISIDNPDTLNIMKKVFKEEYDNVKNNFKIFQGIVTGENDAYLFDNKEDALKKGIPEELLKPVLFGKDINKYDIETKKRCILYLTKNTEIKKYPEVKKWLLNFDKIRKIKREKTKSKWHALHRPRKQDELDLKEKILVQRTRNEKLYDRIVATIDDTGIYGVEGLFFIIPKTENYSLYFLLAILNSKLINYVFTTKFLNVGLKKNYLEIIPLPHVTMDNQKKLIKLSKQQLELHKEYQNTNALHESVRIEDKIEDTQQQIERNVYELYNLSKNDIEVIDDYLETRRIK